MTTKQLFLEGRPVKLGPRIGKGGEGEVYALAGDADQALKLYTVDDVLAREAKITAMVRASLARQTSLVSYPSAVVTDARGRFAGFMMKLVKGHQPIHHLYAPGDRKAHFPGADYRFLIRTALNVARAIAVVHARNCVIGDINHSGILVSDKAIVALIDADSFQISDGTTDYLCSVGVPEYTPPELQGKSLIGVRRTPNHDAFGLAVILFQLLCMGRHPFVGTNAQGEMPMERAIADYRFAYSIRRRVGMTPPPGATLLSDFPPPITLAFETAFDRWTARPTAAEWVGLLEQMETQLRRCTTHNLHYYPPAAPECPWCRMERKIGVVLFLPGLPSDSRQRSRSSGPFDLAAAWAAIEAVPLPPATPAIPLLPSLDMTLSVDAIKARRKSGTRQIWGGAVVVLALVGMIGVFEVWPIWLVMAGFGFFHIFGRFKAHEFFRRRAYQAEIKWQAVLVDWGRRCGGPEVLAAKHTLAEIRRQYERLATEHRNRLASYEAYRHDFQLRTYLEGHRLADARIRGVGAGLKAALASWGIDSALGISYQAVIRIDGVGAGKARVLEAWRRQIEARFVFDRSANAADAREKAMIDREVAAKRERLRDRLSRGAHDLRVASQSVAARSGAVDAALLRAHRERGQARIDNDHVNAPILARIARMGFLAWSITLVAMALCAMVSIELFDTAGVATSRRFPLQEASADRLDPPIQVEINPSLGVSIANARSAPSRGAPVVDHILAGHPIMGIARSVAHDGGVWISYVRADGSLAYVSERLLSEIDTRSSASLADSCSSRQWLAQISCHDSTIRVLKEQLDDRLQDLRSHLSSADAAKLAQTQTKWFGRRDACRSAIDETACLGEAYSRRLDELQDLNLRGGRP